MLLLARHAVLKGKTKLLKDVFGDIKDIHAYFHQIVMNSHASNEVKAEVISELNEINIELLALGHELNSKEVINFLIDTVGDIIQDVAKSNDTLSQYYAASTEIFIQYASSFRISQYNNLYPFLIESRMRLAFVSGALQFRDYLERLIRVYIVVKKNDPAIQLLKEFTVSNVDGLSKYYSSFFNLSDKKFKSWLAKINNLRRGSIYWSEVVQAANELRKEIGKYQDFSNSEKDGLLAKISDIESEIIVKTLSIYILAVEIYFNWNGQILKLVKYNNPIENKGNYLNSTPFIENTEDLFEILSNTGFILDSYAHGLIESHTEINYYVFLAILIQLDGLNLDFVLFSNFISNLDYDQRAQIEYVVSQMTDICGKPSVYFDSVKMSSLLAGISGIINEHASAERIKKFNEFEISKSDIQQALKTVLNESAVLKTFRPTIESLKSNDKLVNSTILIPINQIQGLDKRLPGLLTSVFNTIMKSSLKTSLIDNIEGEISLKQTNDFIEMIRSDFDVLFIDIIADKDLYFDFWKNFKQHLISDFDESRYRIGHLRDAKVFNTQLSNFMPPLAILVSKKEDTKTLIDIGYNIVKTATHLQVMMQINFKISKGSSKIFKIMR